MEGQEKCGDWDSIFEWQVRGIKDYHNNKMDSNGYYSVLHFVVHINGLYAKNGTHSRSQSWADLHF